MKLVLSSVRHIYDFTTYNVIRSQHTYYDYLCVQRAGREDVFKLVYVAGNIYTVSLVI